MAEEAGLGGSSGRLLPLLIFASVAVAVAAAGGACLDRSGIQKPEVLECPAPEGHNSHRERTLS